MCYITKIRLYNFDPLQPHFYIVKLGFTGVYIIFLISAQKHRLWVLVRTASARRFYRVPTIYVLSRNMKNIRFFYLKIFLFLVVKFSIYLNRCVFVMIIPSASHTLLSTSYKLQQGNLLSCANIPGTSAIHTLTPTYQFFTSHYENMPFQIY